ncbi:MAG: hypothetical protein NW237_00930 [Cyanobacteriota bacterium]|nr:hypothetical protein [Cyanobacteriota bacterium]
MINNFPDDQGSPSQPLPTPQATYSSSLDHSCLAWGLSVLTLPVLAGLVLSKTLSDWLRQMSLEATAPWFLSHLPILDPNTLQAREKSVSS